MEPAYANLTDAHCEKRKPVFKSRRRALQAMASMAANMTIWRASPNGRRPRPKRRGR